MTTMLIYVITILIITYVNKFLIIFVLMAIEIMS